MKQFCSFLTRLSVAIYCIFLTTSVSGAERIALIVGNGSYQHAGILKNPANDAQGLAKCLRDDGYKVKQILDSDVTEMVTELKLFAIRASEASLAVLFFAGHGIEVDGKNYLLPVDVRLDIDSSLTGLTLDTALKVALERQTLPLDKVLSEIGKIPALKLVILDCCRNNPFANRSWALNRGSNSGLADLNEGDLPPGSMVVYSGAPGAEVPDGSGTNSPFTTALISQLEQRGQSTLNVFTSVSMKVNGGQIPWIKFDGSGRSLGEFARIPLISASNSGGGSGSGLSQNEYFRQEIESVKEQLDYLKKQQENNGLSPVMKQKLVELKEVEKTENFGGSEGGSPVIVSYTKSDGLNIRDSRYIGTDNNIHGALMQYRSAQYPLMQIGEPVLQGGREWVKLQVTGWVRVRNSSKTFLTDQGNGRWKVIWNRRRDPLFMREGTSMETPVFSKLAYATELTALQVEGSFILATFTGWSVIRSETKEFIRELR